MTERVILVEINVTDPVTDVETTLYLSDAPMPPFAPEDADRPNQAYDPRLHDPANISRSLDLENLSGQLGGGAVTISNADLSLDIYRTFAFGSVAIYWGAIGWSFAQFKPLLQGRCGEPEWQLAERRPRRLTLPVYDPRTAFETDMQSNLYAGTNAGGGTGYEGTADDLKDQPKPIALGDLTVANVPATWANAEDVVAQLHDGGFNGVTTIFNGGGDAGMTSAGVLTGALFDAATPLATEYVEDRARGLVKLGSRPVGRVTFDLTGASDGGYLDTSPELIEKLLLDHGAAVGNIGDSFAVTVAAQKVGLWIADPTATITVASLLALSIGAVLLPDQIGRWQLITIDAPVDPPIVTLTDSDILRLSAIGGLRTTPTHKVTVRYAHNYTVMSGGDLQGSVEGTSRETYLSSEWRLATSTAPPTLTRWPDALSRTYDTALVNEADAVALAARLLTLFGPRADGTPRRGYSVAIELTEASLDYEPGQTLRLFSDELEIDALMIIVGVSPTTPSRNLITLELYG